MTAPKQREQTAREAAEAWCVEHGLLDPGKRLEEGSFDLRLFLAGRAAGVAESAEIAEDWCIEAPFHLSPNQAYLDTKDGIAQAIRSAAEGK